MMRKNQLVLTAKSIALLLCVTTLLMLSSCGGNSKKTEKGTPIEFSKSNVKKLQENIEENEDKRFSIEGYLSYSTGFTVYTNRPQTVSVKSDIDSKDFENNIAISMPWKKDGKNSVYMPDNSDDPIFYDNEGKPLTQKDKVIVSFSVTTTNAFPTDIRLDKAQ